jgi:hypothetical protein
MYDRNSNRYETEFETSRDYYEEIGDHEKLNELFRKGKRSRSKTYKKKDYSGKKFELRSLRL